MNIDENCGKCACCQGILTGACMNLPLEDEPPDDPIVKPLESKIENDVIKWAKKNGLEFIKLNITSRRGYPDRLFFIPGGRPFLLELKRPGERPEKLQQYQMDRLKRKGYDVAWTDDAKVAIGWLRERICR